MDFVNKIKEKVFLSENAKLFDTREYLIKTFVAVLIAAYIGSVNNYLSKDMISLLFGMMLTLEPVNMSGIRSGLSQIQATIIGAVVTAIVVLIFGYNIVATALAITLTLYVCMVINWREMMVVAVFTAIYMTQFVQVNTLGDLSSVETFKLRMAALGTGVLIAFIVNFIFSLIGYRRMVNKRIYFISKEIYDLSFNLKVGLAKHDMAKVEESMAKLPPLFNNIDWVTSTLADVKNDQKRFKVVYRHFDADKFISYSKALRGITHVTYDLCHRINIEPDGYMNEGFVLGFEERLGYFESVKDAFEDGKDIPVANWKDSDYPWLNHYSKALGQLSKNA